MERIYLAIDIRLENTKYSNNPFKKINFVNQIYGDYVSKLFNNEFIELNECILGNDMAVDLLSLLAMSSLACRGRLPPSVRVTS